MKKFNLLLLSIIIIACSSTSEVVDVETKTTSTTVTDNQTTNTTQTSTDKPEEVVEEYVFDVERMSALTGLEIAPELWLKRPRRVLAFKVDNNINARPQSGLQEADSVFEILVEGGMTRFLAFFLDKSSS